MMKKKQSIIALVLAAIVTLLGNPEMAALLTSLAKTMKV